MTSLVGYCPAWASAPGETVRELARKKGVSSSRLAEALGVSNDELPRILGGELPITVVQAEELAKLLGVSRQFWINREALYRKGLQSLHEEGREWILSLPLADMAKFGWLKTATLASEKIRNAFEFFGVSSVDEWRDVWLSERIGLTAYRTSPTFTIQAASAAAWLRQGELAASQLRTKAWSREGFERLLPELKPLTRVSRPDEFLPELQRRCATCGVAVVIVRAPKGCPASGAARVKNSQAILQLSVRYLRDDSFWFTFFHEAGHLVLHEDRLFLEFSEVQQLDSEDEKAANEFAARLLIPHVYEAALRALPHDHKSIMRFARNISISPGIVVGQLQHRGIVGPEKLNFLKKRYSWDGK